MISSLTPDAILEHGDAGVPIELRKARMSDIARLLELINGYAARGIMLPRTELEISEVLRDFSVAYSGDQLVGCGALHFYTPTTGEIRSLAVQESAKSHGIGRRMVEMLLEEAHEYSLDAVFAFTYVADFFRKLGFEAVERGALPLKAWKDCLRCPKFHCCDEVAVMRVLRPEHWVVPPPKWGVPDGVSDGAETIVLPIVRKY
ncbi:MAG TPA: N-acetyltransferase [Bryobacteraceae bacterium]|nr:N-acetyltransferase [Bryobacteraceae bacterium]